MRTIKYLSSLLFAGAVILLPSTVSATESNQASYWETETTTCVKYEGSQDGTGSVTLTESVALLIVKGGSVDTGNGPGNAVYVNPGPGSYSTPVNNGGNIPTVSHWIVCTTIPPVTTPETTVPADEETTTTTVALVPAPTPPAPTPVPTTATPAVLVSNQLPSTGAGTNIALSLAGILLVMAGGGAVLASRRK